MNKLEVLTKLATRSGSHSIKLIRRDGGYFVAEYKNGHKWNEETVRNLNDGLTMIEDIRQEELSDGINLIKCQGYSY